MFTFVNTPILSHLTYLLPLAFITLSSCSTNTPELNDESNTPKVTTDGNQITLPDTLLTKLNNNMVWVKGGHFIMGSDSSKARNREKPAHEVSLDSFYISRFEMTQDIFTEVMGWNTSYFRCDNCPVNNLSWLNMQLFIERLNKATGKTFRLPTEAEWEYAAKGGNKSKNYTFSGSNTIDNVAWFADNAKRQSHPVGLKQANELGLYDMTGNLWEFCQDNMSRTAYQQTEKHNPFFGIKTPTPGQLKRKSMKVLRGGGYEFSADESLVFIRDGATNNVRMADIGFRLAMSKQ